MVDEVIETGPDALKKKRDELLLTIKPQEAPKLTDPEVLEKSMETERLNILEEKEPKASLS